MPISHSRISVGTSATKLTNDYDGRSGQTINVQNPADGGADVTTTSYGYLLGASTSFSVEMQTGEKLYAVVASGTQTVNVLRQGA
jgi:hypothetical protein